MFRKTPNAVLFASIVLALILAGCGSDSTAPPAAAPTQDDELSIEVLDAELGRIPVGDPSEQEIADMLFMREEEKLGHDVYTFFYDQYEMNIFTNIASSEERHAAAVKMLLDRYGLEDPAEGNGPGEFSNETLQDLYDALIAGGGQSLADALLAGLEIEERDILDLEAALERTELQDILMVYGKLLKGSHSHLRAFVKVYELKTGEVYEPRWLSQEAYDEILSEEQYRGRRDGRLG